MDLWFEWREENNDERFSFEDSDRFEEDSLVSWNSEPESICANWRGWKHGSQSQNGANFVLEKDEQVDSLIEICAKTVAKTIPFEAVEQSYPQIPEQIQLRIAFWSFPQVEDDIRLYSCLANGSPDEFQRGEHLVRAKAVRDPLQIGFHLSATVNQQHSSVQTKGMFSVAVTFDRGHITSCNCTCSQSATWCAHIIALCLFRIYHPDQVCLRAPVSEYLSRLRRDQLQKFAQYLISELPQQLLPTAQRLLDELLSSQESAINTLSGAPDPTAGPAATDHNRWCMDEKGLRENVRKMLTRFCGPVPLVFSDVSAVYMSNTAPPTAAEWSNLLRPLKGREPEGMWNLLYIVRELFNRRDSNSIKLLSTLSEECLANDQVVIWWFDSRSQASGSSAHRNHGNGYRNNTNAASTEATKHACAGFCDELVVLWRLAALNPKLSDEERQDLKVWLEQWNQDAVAKARAGHGAGFQAAVACFPGFHPAIEACSLTWENIDLSSDSEKSEDLCNYSPMNTNLNEDTKIDDDARAIEGTIVSANEESSLVDLYDTDENLEVLCARAEALHVHGYSAKASKLAVQLALKILELKPQLNTNPANKQTKSTSFSSTTLVKAAFLCGVLAEDPLCHHLAFKVGMFGLEMPRQPAKSKALEVKLAHQESELTALLRKLPLRAEEMMVVREKANLICQGKLQRGAVLPIMLATFIFEVLCCPGKASKETKNDQQRKMDEDIGYMAAFCALGMRPSILESYYPILCEGIRRQRGDLAIAMLDYCKDNSTRLKAVKEVLLDKTRYEGPGFVSEVERQNDPRDNDNDKKKTEENSTRNRGFGLSPRRGSNSQSSSYTSDSGTDSGSRDSSGHNRGKNRPANNKIQSRQFNVPTAEERREDESGSSSGVDTDSAVNHPSPSVNHPSSLVNHPSPNVSAKVVGVCQIPRNVTDSSRWGTTSAQGTSGTRSSPRGTESRRGKPKENSRKLSKDRATSDLEGSDEDVGNDDGIVVGGVSLSPSNNVTVKVREIAISMHNSAARDTRKDSSSSNELSDNDKGIARSNRGTSSTVNEQGISNVTQSDDTNLNDRGAKLECDSEDISVSKDDVSEPSGADNRNDSASSIEQDLGPKRRQSLSDSSGNISPASSSSSSNISSSGSPACVAPKGISQGKKKRTRVTFKTEGLPGPPKEAQPTSSSSTAGQQSNRIDENTETSLLAESQERSPEAHQASTKVGGSEIEYPDEVFESNDQASQSCDEYEKSVDKNNTRSEADNREDLGVGCLTLCESNEEQKEAISTEASGLQETVEEGGSASASGWTEKDTEEDNPTEASGWTNGQAANDPSVDESGWVEDGGIQPGAVGAQGEAGNNAEDNRVSSGRQRRGNKKNRRKKKGKNSAINQATEAEAHFMFELAKTVLTRAGGNSNTSVFSTPSTTSSHAGPHRGLQLCAFELGLFALGLHNRTSVNWLSRTYSSHVSWISGQAMEIGSAAIQLLIERWEGNLTPSEVASISDRASRSNDPTMVRAAAELGLSCLHMAHTLNPGEIQRALLQCRDEDTQLLDRACQAVESAARGGGVYPEVLFDVARHWHHLHEQNQASTSRQHKENSRRGSQSSRSQTQPAASSPSSSGTPLVHPSPLGPHAGFSVVPPPPYQTAEQYVQTQMHQQVQHLMNPSGYTNNSTYRATSQPNYGFNSRQLHSNQFQISGTYGGLPPPYQSCHPSVCQLSSRTQSGQVSYYLNNAYRVGMLALESLARRTPDDRPNVKYSRNPPCSDDIRWLCSLSARLGTSYLHRFCVSALNAVVSPFVLHEIALEAARHLARSNPAQLAVNLRSPNISPLVQKSLSMYGQCIHHNLMIMAQSDHEEFVELLRHARGAFCMVPGGMSQFNELLQSIRRLYPKKKDLWQKIMTGLAKA